MGLLFLTLLFSLALSVPISGPSILTAVPVDLLSSARYGSASCVIGQFLIVAGGYDSSIAPSITVDVIDMATATKVDTKNLTSPHADFSAAVVGVDCLIVGGLSGTLTRTSSVDKISIDLVTGVIQSITSQPAYPGGNVSDLSCVREPQNGNVWCFGGTDGTNPVSYVGYFNGVAWTAGTPLPVAIDFVSRAGKCVHFESKFYCCGAAAIPDFCQVLDFAVPSWSNFSVTYRTKGGIAVVDFPTPTLLLWGGYNATLPVHNVDAIQSGALVGTYGTTYSTSSLGAAFGIGTYAVGFSAKYDDTFYASILTSLNAQTTPIVEGAYVATSNPDWVSKGFSPQLFQNVGGAHHNRAFFCGGYNQDAAAPTSYCWYFDLVCLGTSASGRDGWVNNFPTYVGCDMIQCNLGYYGSSCTACNCNGQGCNDGFYGTGACTCQPGYYGASCTSQQVCSGNGIANDGVNGDGACLCYEGFTGADCSQVVSANCSANAIADGSSCLCLSGYYGADCSGVCSCGVGATCNLVDGSCFCAPGTYTIPGATQNCSGSCTCVHGFCDDGNYGTGACACASGYFGADCATACNCPPVVVSPNEILLYRCDDGASGTGACVPLYSSASLASTFFGLVSVCLALFFL